MKSWQKWALGIGGVTFIVIAPHDASHIVTGIESFFSTLVSSLHLH